MIKNIELTVNGRTYHLDVDMVMGDTRLTPDEGMTVGSMSLQTSGNAIRQMAAEARQILLQLAIEELEAWPNDLHIEDGKITNPATGAHTNYWHLYGGKSFNHTTVKYSSKGSSKHSCGVSIFDRR